MIFINSLDYWLFLFKWESKIYMNIFLSFNLYIISFIFNFFNKDLYWILKWIFNHNIIHYLDDFLFIQDSNSEFFDILIIYLNLSEKLVKYRDNHIIDFTNIELDIHFMEIRLSKNKHDHALLKVKYFLYINIIIYHILEKLLEFLFFYIKVILLSHFFLYNLFNLLNRLFHLHSHVIHHLSSAVQYDLLWWTIFLSQWSSIYLIIFSYSQIIIHTNINEIKEIDDWWNSDHIFSIYISYQHRIKFINWKKVYIILFIFMKWNEL